MLKISRDSEINLINLMIDHDLISAKDLIAIQKTSDNGAKSQIQSVFELNLTNEDKILDILVQEQALEITDLSSVQASEELKKILPSEFVTTHFIAPFKISEQEVHIAISDSSKLMLVRNLKTLTNKNISFYAATISQIDHLIQQLHPEVENESSQVESQAPANYNQTNAQNTNLEKAKGPKIKTFDSNFSTNAEALSEKPEEEIEAIENESEVIKFSTAVIAEAIKLGVSDIHIEPYRFSSRVRFRLDGMLQEQKHFSGFLHDNFGAVVTRFKIMGKLDIAERRLPQDGAIPFKIDGKVVDLRLSILPTASNERIVMRILNKDAGNVTLEQLNFEEDVLVMLRKAIHSTQGLILVTGPTGSGKTTTLYSILQEVSQPHLNILTAEDPVEFELDGVGQVQIKEDIGYTFASALRSFLRQDPEIILVGEMRDKETVDIGLKAALTGHLVFSTLHTNDAPSTITRLQNMGTPDYLISAACSLVLAQRLARRTCPDCKIPDDDVNQQVLKDLGCSDAEIASAKVMKGKGCPNCKNTGFKGRMGLYEVLNVTKPIKEAILQKATTPEIKAIAIKEGFRTMQDMGRKMIVDGNLNFREYERVLTS